MTTQLPTAFVQQMEQLLGHDEAKSLFEALSLPSPTSIRLNPFKWPRIEQSALPPHTNAVPWAIDAYYLATRPTFTTDPLLHAGAYYVQEASSMAITAVASLLPNAPITALDLCAAPGGKSTLWRSILPEGSLLIANEPLPQRAHILSENITKWGHTDIAVTNNYPADFAPLIGCFDLIATDVPCSGEGMFRKDATAIAHWSEANVATCYTRQRTIIEDIWPSLRTGGLLVYSTCTYNRYEDEDNVRYICDKLGAEPIALPLPETSTGILRDADGHGLPFYHFYPHRTKGEGFFLAVLRKTANTPTPKASKSKGKSVAVAPKRVIDELSPWINHPTNYTWRATTSEVWIEPREHTAIFELIYKHLRIIQCGTPIATYTGKRWQPAHALAMATTALHTDAFPRHAVDGATALAYLRAEALILPPNIARGYVLLTYRGLPLGFVNNLGTRANNLYPDAWRIRSIHATEVTHVL